MKDSKIYKVLRIVFLTLAIISMVFALMKKVGLAASDSSSEVFTSLPLPVGSGYGNTFSNYGEIVNNITNYVLSKNDPDFPSVDLILNWDFDNNGVYTFRVYSSPSFSVESASNFFNWDSPAHISIRSSARPNYWNGYGQVTYDTNTNTCTSWNYNSAWTSFATSNYLTSLPNNSYGIVYNGYISYYPLFISSDLVYDGVTYFSVTANSGGIDSPGWSEAFDEWIDDEINPVDTDSPVDSSNTPSWLQKILSGLGTLNNTIGSGFTLIKNNIGSTRDKITEIYDYITEGPDPVVIGNNVAGALYETQLFTSFDSAKTSITGVYNSFSNVSAKTSSQVAFSIPFSLPYIDFSSNFIIDFAWYENVRSVIEPFLNMVLSVGFLFSLIRSIPGILHGNSGEGDT